MALAENISRRLVYKAYADATYSSTTEPDPATDPASSGGQILRYVTENLAITKDYYTPTEKRTDRTQAMGRHGTRRGPGTITGMLSPGTYGDLLEASLQGTWAAAVTASQSDFTSVSAVNSTSKFIFTGGNPVTKGLRIGDIFRFTNLSDADNNGKNFLILEFGGSNNRELTVYPAPDDMTADAAFSLTTVGQSLYRPTSSHVSRKFAFEVWDPEPDIAKLYTEGKIGGFNLGLPSDNNGTIDFQVMCRNRQKYSSGSAPFFSAPTAATTTKILSGVNGILYINGSRVGVATGLTVAYAMAPNGPSVIGNGGLLPAILLPSAVGTGNLQAVLQDATLGDLFDNETEIGLLMYLTATSDDDTPYLSMYLPRIKFNSDTESDGNALARQVSHDFAFATYEGSAAGVANTAIRFCDSEIS